MRRVTSLSALIGVFVLAGVGGSMAFGAVSANPRDALIAGRVLVCNVPGHCLTRTFEVSATDASGRTVATTRTRSPRNAYRLRLAPGSYELVANSSGLVCQASATATAHRTTRQNITCLVP
jgi:hypothetical protein